MARSAIRVGLSCSLVSGEHDTIHRLIFPEEEMPKRLLLRENRSLAPGRATVLEMSPGEKFVATAWLVLHRVERPKLGYRYLLDAAWQHAYRPTAARRTAAELWTMGVRYAKESLWDPQARMFALALCSNGKQNWRRSGPFAIGWAGRNGELAVGLLEDYLNSGDKTLRDMALACLDAWAARARPASPRAAGIDRFLPIANDATTLADGADGILECLWIGQEVRYPARPTWKWAAESAMPRWACSSATDGSRGRSAGGGRSAPH